jgi:hypothetical protein
VASELIKRAKLLIGRDKPASPRPAARKPIKQFHAVTIVPGAHACIAAHGQFGQRFLSRDAPPLPLKACESARCECRYEHYDDRRGGPRRARELAVSIDGYEGAEQRGKSRRGRRKAD